MIYFLMGKSASGKDGIGSMLLNDNTLSLKPVVLYTTRPMRDGEREGTEYHFCTENDLKKFREAGDVIEERVYHTVQGDWYYFTLADEEIKNVLAKNGDDYLAIGTLEAYTAYKDYFGEELIIPIYIEVRDDLRLMRAIERERGQKTPDYRELCRRFLADEEDFSSDKLKAAGIDRTFKNDNSIEECYSEILKLVMEGTYPNR